MNVTLEFNLTLLFYRKAEAEPKWKNVQSDAKYRCLVCNSYLRFPVQFEDCGHHVCSSCLPDIMRYEYKYSFDLFR